MRFVQACTVRSCFRFFSYSVLQLRREQCIFTAVNHCHHASSAASDHYCVSRPTALFQCFSAVSPWFFMSSLSFCPLSAAAVVHHNSCCIYQLLLLPFPCIPFKTAVQKNEQWQCVSVHARLKTLNWLAYSLRSVVAIGVGKGGGREGGSSSLTFFEGVLAPSLLY